MTAPAWRRVRVHVAGANARGVAYAEAVWDGWVREIAGVLSRLSGGGCTIHAPSDGCWRGQREPVQVVEALVTYERWGAGGRAELEAVLQRYLAATCQETVLVTAEYLPPDEVLFVSSHDSEGVVSFG